MSIGEHFVKLIFDKDFKSQINFLKKVTLFEGVSDRALGKITGIMHSKKYPAGETVFSEGQEGKLLYIIKAGEIAIVKGNKTISTLGAGEFFGEMALLEEIPRTAAAVAAKDSELILVYKVKFDELLESYPAAGVKVVKNIAAMLSSRIRQMQNSQHGTTD
jgi:CRP-like cAMP-binding protein